MESKDKIKEDLDKLYDIENKKIDLNDKYNRELDLLHVEREKIESRLICVASSKNYEMEIRSRKESADLKYDVVIFNNEADHSWFPDGKVVATIPLYDVKEVVELLSKLNLNK